MCVLPTHAKRSVYLCVDVLDSLDLTMDENKENQTPEGVQGDLDWVQQYGLEQEREEQELQQALAQSLQEHVRPPTHTRPLHRETYTALPFDILLLDKSGVGGSPMFL